jgi:hypothetical protein
MALPKLFSASSLSVAGVVLLVGGLGIAIFASQQQQDNRSKASGPQPGDFVGSGVLQTTSGNTVNPGSPGPAVTLPATPGVTYKIQISGTYQYQYTRTTGTSAGRWTDVEWDDWQQSGNNGCYCRRIGRSKIDINDTQVQSIDYHDASNPNHVYTYRWTANTDFIKLQVWDTHYHDNSGTLSYSVVVESVPPPQPTNVTATCSDSGTKLTVNWTPVSGYAHYYARIYDETTDAVAKYTEVITGSTYSIDNAVPGHKYSYWVHTTNAGGDPWSPAVPPSRTAFVTCPVPGPTATPAPSSTKFDLNLLFHGIGKGGDNRNPNGGGNPTPLHPTRSVIVDVYDFDDQAIITGKEGQVTFDPVTGMYKGTVQMGTTLTAQAYTIKVKLSQSLRGSISRNIVVGSNVIPVMSLVNGDANNDAKLDIEDYNIIQGCYSDFDLPPVDCNAIKKAQADIDDDGNVNQFDMNLFLREMSVQQL